MVGDDGFLNSLLNNLFLEFYIFIGFPTGLTIDFMLKLKYNLNNFKRKVYI